MSTEFLLRIPPAVFSAMIGHGRAELPNECCGLLAGVMAGGVGEVRTCFPLVNALHSPVAYESEARSMFDAVRAMRAAGTDVLAVYHSHPTSAAVPSRSDLARNYSPDVVNLIISFAADPPEVRGWWLAGETYRQARWSLTGEG